MRAMKDSGIAWIGEIPEDWEIKKLKYTFFHSNAGEVIDKSYWNCGSELLYTCQKEPINSNYSGFPEAKRTGLNDLLLTRNATPYVFIPETHSIYSNVVQRISLRQEYDRRYIRYSLLSAIDSLVALGDTIPSYNMEIWENITLPIMQQQHRIADYLDRKCSQIDAIIARQQEVIEKLKAYKLSVITEAVTKGLNPHAPMKDSGVEWIGKVPEQWKVAKLKFVASFYNGDRSSKYPSGTDIVDEGVIFVTSNNLGNTFLDTTISTKYITKEKYDDLGGAKIRINDIIFCLRGSVGKCSINKSENEGTIASSLVVIRAKKILADYLIFALQCPGITAVSTLNAIGIGSLNLSADDISEIFIPIPPEKEAAEIAEFLYKRIGKIDHVINEKNNYVNHFVMYKKSLIYEVVTGKKEV